LKFADAGARDNAMGEPYELVQLAQHAVSIIGLAASAASLAACVTYRRVSGSMALLIVAFAGDAVVTFLYLALGLATQYAPDALPDDTGVLYLLVGGLGMVTAVMTAVGLFQVFGDVARRQDRYGGAGPSDDYGPRRQRDDEGDDLRWERRPGGPDYRR
jgi:hypothetical protein